MSNEFVSTKKLHNRVTHKVCEENQIKLVIVYCITLSCNKLFLLYNKDVSLTRVTHGFIYGTHV